MKNNKVVFILIDALRSDYINETDSPFLSSYARNNKFYASVSQSRSFCERAEIFTGLSPRESGYFTALGFTDDREPNHLRLLNSFLTFCESMLGNGIIFRKLRNIVLKHFTVSSMKAYSIPQSILSYFRLTEDEYDFRDPRALGGGDNLLRLCSRLNIQVFFDSFTSISKYDNSTDESRLNLVEENFKHDYGLYLLYIGQLDSVGHKFGPNSSQRRDTLKSLDARIEGLYQTLIKENENTQFVILGDHGMVEVKKSVNIQTEIDNVAISCGAKLGQDFVYFLDSTIFRFWCLNPKKELRLKLALSRNVVLLENGIFVDESFAKKEKIPFPDRRYGEVLWLANTGVLIFPDFFHTTKPYKGMHGYDANIAESQGVCIVTSSEKGVVENILLTDIFKILKKKLNNLYEE